MSTMPQHHGSHDVPVEAVPVEGNFLIAYINGDSSRGSAQLGIKFYAHQGREEGFT